MISINVVINTTCTSRSKAALLIIVHTKGKTVAERGVATLLRGRTPNRLSEQFAMYCAELFSPWNAINQSCLTFADQFFRLADGSTVSTSDQLGNISLQPAVRGDNFSTSNLYSKSPPSFARCNPSTFTNFFQSCIVWKNRKILWVINDQFFIPLFILSQGPRPSHTTTIFTSIFPKKIVVKIVAHI